MTIPNETKKCKSGISLSDLVRLEKPIVSRADLPKAKWWYPKKAHTYGFKWLAATYFGTHKTPVVVASRFGEESRHGLIDIDRGSQWHTQEFASSLMSTASRLGLKLIWLESSKSGGWHFVLTSSEWLDSGVIFGVLLRLVSECLNSQFRIEKGQCEIYPNPQCPKQAVRLPCGLNQRILGSSFGGLTPVAMNDLDGRGRLNLLFKLFGKECSNPAKKLQEIGIKHSGTFATETISSSRSKGTSTSSSVLVGNIADWITAIPAVEELKPSEDLVRAYNYLSRTRYAGKRGQWDDPTNPTGYNRYQLGLDWYRTGLLSDGERNEALKSVGFMLFMSGYKDAEIRAKMLVTWLVSKHNGNSKDWKKNPSSVIKEIVRMTKWQPKSYKDAAVREKEKADEANVVEKKVNPGSGMNRSNAKTREVTIERLGHTIDLLREYGLATTYENVLGVSKVSKKAAQKVTTQLGVSLRNMCEVPEVRTLLSDRKSELLRETIAARVVALKAKTDAGVRLAAQNQRRQSEKNENNENGKDVSGDYPETLRSSSCLAMTRAEYSIQEACPMMKASSSVGVELISLRRSYTRFLRTSEKRASVAAMPRVLANDSMTCRVSSGDG